MVRAPERPARIASQVSGTVPPTGVVAPRPVTTTRRCSVMAGCAPSWRSCGEWGWVVATPAVCRVATTARTGGSALVLGDEGHRVAHGHEVLHLVVGDADAEFL